MGDGGARARGGRAGPSSAAVALAVAALVVAAAGSFVPASAQDDRWRAAFERGLEQLREGRHEDSLATFERLARERPEVPEAPYNAACACALLGRREQALVWLERAIERGFRDLDHIEKDADLDALRLDAAFDALLEKRLGRPTPPAWLATLDGAPADLARLRGQVVVLVLWSPRSEPSHAQALAASQLDADHRDGGLVVLAAAEDDRDAQERFADTHKLGLGLLRRLGPGPRPFSEARALPTTFVFDRRGLLRHRLTGVHAGAELEALVLPLLADGAAPPRLPDPPPPAPRRTF